MAERRPEQAALLNKGTIFSGSRRKKETYGVLGGAHDAPLLPAAGERNRGLDALSLLAEWRTGQRGMERVDDWWYGEVENRRREERGGGREAYPVQSPNW